MSFQPPHFGLYFGQDSIDYARQQRDKNDDLQTAWQWLLASSGDVVKEIKSKNSHDEPEKIIKPKLIPLGQVIEDATCYRFMDDGEAGEQAIETLETGWGLSDQATLFDTVTQVLAIAHAFEMLRDRFPNTDRWLQDFADFSGSLIGAQGEVDYLDRLWLISLNIVSGVVLEDETRFIAGVTAFRKVIDDDLHPEGYFKPLVENAKVSEIAFRDMVLACAALTLAAEATARAGENLWRYENRDVGVNTAVTYLVYYYFYPAKWRWGEDDLTEEQTKSLFGELGAWIEISTGRINPRGVELLLDEQRPFFNPYMGGLTTLTHFSTEKRKKRGIFW